MISKEYYKILDTTNNEIKKEKPSTKIKRRQYTLEDKMNIINQYKSIKQKFPQKGLKKIANELNIDDHTLREWRQLKDFINTEKNKRLKYRLVGGGRNPQTLNIENNLLIWISEMRRLDICINTNQIIYKALELDSTLKNKSYNALLCWCYDFLKRNLLSIRKTTNVGQKLKANSFEE